MRNIKYIAVASCFQLLHLGLHEFVYFKLATNGQVAGMYVYWLHILETYVTC